jgi:hypothetical protein
LTSRHPALSPDLASSDIFLCGALKGQLAGRTFESNNELVEGIGEMTSAVPIETAFLEWEERLQRCIDINDIYVDPTVT